MSENRGSDTIQDLLARALEQPAAARDAFLLRSCAGDAGLLAELRSLLASHERAGRFLADPNFMGRPIPGAADLHPLGSSIGPYVLVQLIGEGGYGTVYLAEQHRPIRRRVALKVIKAGMDTRQVIARFELERQALAMMDHPHIARVLEAGATEAGRPYFVMELVDGRPITEHCKANGLDLHARLALFDRVCSAVRHAHQKGIIHRDLKPSNVLIALQEGRPVPKIIDFGIAKALGGSLEPWRGLTEEPQLLGTPQYMSPEQAQGSRRDIDTRSDVYALGVLLYELLTDRSPFDVGPTAPAAGYGELQRLILEAEPPTPSDRLLPFTAKAGASADDADDAARLRKRWRQLRGDLDWIVMKAIEKDRDRRYGSVEALAEDVRRFVDHEPVHARRPSGWRKAAMFARRNRAPLLAAGAVAAALVAGLSVGLVQARHQRDRALLAMDAEARERAAAERARAVAVENEKKAREESRRLWDARTFLFQLISPTFDQDAQGGVPVAVLDYVAQRLDDGSLGDQPLAEAPLRAALGNEYVKRRLFPQAERNFQVNLRMCRTFGPEESINLASAIANLANVLSLRTDKDAETEALFREAAVIYRKLDREGSVAIAPVLTNFGTFLANTDRLDEAEQLLNEALQRYRRAYGDVNAKVPRVMDHLADVAAARGNPTSAATLRRTAADIRSRLRNATTGPTVGD